MNAAPVAAVINSTPDIVDMLRIALEYAGFVVVSALTFEIRDGEANLEELIRQHEPGVIVYDVAPPYEANWRLFEHISAMPIMRGGAVARRVRRGRRACGRHVAPRRRAFHHG